MTTFSQQLAASVAADEKRDRMAALSREFEAAGGEAKLGVSESEYASMFDSEMLDDLGAGETADANTTPAMAALSAEFEAAGGEAKLGISESEYVGMFSRHLADGLPGGGRR